MKDTFELNAPDDLRSEVRPIAGTRFPLLVVDNIYKRPEAVRELALSLDYEALGPKSPGGRASCPSDRVVRDLAEVIEHHVGDLYGWSSSQVHPEAPVSSRFHRMRCKGATSGSRVTMPHIDTVMLAGVVYLNLPDQCRGGTAFFRHRGTGVTQWRVRTRWEVAPNAARAAVDLGFDEVYREGLRAGRWRSYDELRARIFDAPSGEENFMSEGGPHWEQIDRTEMRWNRLICFPGFVFHTSLYDPSWFGDTPQSDRVIQNLLLNWPRRTHASSS
ncbi:MAG: DUF6445 family protein [Nannocystaceae bacterium]|nr:DUF6445 family protein [bacterium]